MSHTRRAEVVVIGSSRQPRVMTAAWCSPGQSVFAFLMRNSQIPHRPKDGSKPGHPPMQTADAVGGCIRRQVSLSAAPKVASPLSSPYRACRLRFPTGRLRRLRAGAKGLASRALARGADMQKSRRAGARPGGGGADRRSGRSQLAVRRISLSIGSCVPLTPSVTEPPAPPPTTSWTIPLLVMPTGTAWPFASMPVSASV